MKKTLASLIISVLLLTALSPLTFATDAPSALLDGGGVAARLEHVMNESGYTVGTPEYNCYLFAKRVFYKLFEYDENPNINYHGDYDSAGYTTQLIGRVYTPMSCSIDSCGGRDPVTSEAKSYTIGAVTPQNVGALLDLAKPGDVLQGHSSNNVHTMIVVEVIRDESGSATGVDVYHGNYNSMISRNTFTNEHLAATYDHAFSVYRATNYQMMDIGAAVYFDGAGGTPSFKSTFVSGGEPIGELPTATRAGYTFAGWYTSESGGYEADPATVPTAFELTYYAHWTANEYTVSFDSCGGDLAPEAKTVDFGSEYGSLPLAGEKIGYSFTGWYTSPDGGTSVDEDALVTTAFEHTLYAHWAPNQYEVTFSLGGGSSDVSGTTVTYGEPYGALPVPTREGYIFTGWATDERGVNRRTAATPAVKASDHTLYAQWVEGIASAPADFTAQADGSAAQLHWAALEGANGYQIYRRAAGEEHFARISTEDGGNVTLYTDGSRASGTPCEYRIRAYRALETGTIYGPWSETASA